MLWLVAALASLAAATPAAHCDILHARYQAPGAPAYHLHFVRLASREGVVSDIGIHIFGNDPKAELWYYPDEGSARKISLISTIDPTRHGWHAVPDGGVRPHGSATYIGMHSDGIIDEDAPTSGSQAPAFVIIPELGQVYKNLAEYPLAAFVLRGCDD